MLQTPNPENNIMIFNLAQKLGVEIERDCEEIIVKVPPKKGEGVMVGINLPFGVTAIIFQCTLKSAFQVTQSRISNQPLRFIYVKNGNLKHTFNETSIHYEISKGQCVISAGDKKGSDLLALPTNEKLEILIIEIDRSKFIEKIECDLYALEDKLAKVFKDTEADNVFYRSSFYSISIEECLATIMNNRRDSTIRRYFAEAKIYEIFSHQFKQFADDIKPDHKTSVLRKNDIELIKKAKTHLVEDLSDAPTIPELARLVGINQQKLKKGFKEIYNTTPYRYLRNTRLNESKLLLIEGSLSVSEVAERIGYSNKSHFAKRFKEKFGILPYKFIKSFKSQL